MTKKDWKAFGTLGGCVRGVVGWWVGGLVGVVEMVEMVGEKRGGRRLLLLLVA